MNIRNNCALAVLRVTANCLQQIHLPVKTDFKKEAVQVHLQYFTGQLVLNSIQKKTKLEENIDLILKKLDFIKKRLDDIESKYDYLSVRIADLEEKGKSRNLKADNECLLSFNKLLSTTFFQQNRTQKLFKNWMKKFRLLEI